MSDIFITVQMDDTDMKTRGHVLTDDNGTKTFPSTDAINVAPHYEGMFDYFKGTFCLVH